MSEGEVNMKDIKFTLGKTIEEIDTTANAVAVQARIRPNAVYDLVNKKAPSITFKTLTKILEALDVIAQEKDINRTFDECIKMSEGEVNMKDIKFTLGKTIEEIDTTANAVAVQARIRPNAVYDLVNKKAPSITFKTLTKILEALDVIAQEKDINRTFDVSDVFVYE